jgi:cytochrome c oxidase subunit 1
MMGGTVMGLLAGLHFWFPKMTGRMLSEKMARYAWLLMFVGFNVTFFTQFIMGFEGMPRRYAEYPAQYQMLNIVSTVGSWVLAAGILIMFANFVRRLPRTPGKRSPWIGRPGRRLPRRISGKPRRSATGRTATRAGKPDGP